MSLEVFPQHKSSCSCRTLLYVPLFFVSPLFLCLFNLEFQNLLLSVPYVLSYVLFCSLSFPSYSLLLFFLFPVLFSPFVYSLYFLISVIVFFSNLLSFLFFFPSTLFCLLLHPLEIPYLQPCCLFFFCNSPIPQQKSTPVFSTYFFFGKFLRFTKNLLRFTNVLYKNLSSR